MLVGCLATAVAGPAHGRSARACARISPPTAKTVPGCSRQTLRPAHCAGTSRTASPPPSPSRTKDPRPWRVGPLPRTRRATKLRARPAPRQVGVCRRCAGEVPRPLGDIEAVLVRVLGDWLGTSGACRVVEQASRRELRYAAGVVGPERAAGVLTERLTRRLAAQPGGPEAVTDPVGWLRCRGLPRSGPRTDARCDEGALMPTGAACERCADLPASRRQRRARVSAHVRAEVPDAVPQIRQQVPEHRLPRPRRRPPSRPAGPGRAGSAGRRRRAGCAGCAVTRRPSRAICTKRCSLQPLPRPISTTRSTSMPYTPRWLPPCGRRSASSLGRLGLLVAPTAPWPCRPGSGCGVTKTGHIRCAGSAERPVDGGAHGAATRPVGHGRPGRVGTVEPVSVCRRP